MVEFFTRLLDTSDFPARWNCGRWSAFDGWLHIISDSLIFLAYAAIPATLIVLVRARRDFAFTWVVWLFIAFILSCGITHLIEAMIFWWPVYRISGLTKAVTAGVSLLAAVMVIRAMPEILRLPSVKKANEELAAALAREHALHEELTRVHGQLEKRTSTLAIRERRMREAVGAAKACATVWEVESGAILWEAGFFDAMASAGIDWQREFDSWASLIGERAAAELRDDARQAALTDSVLHRRFDLPGHELLWELRVTATPEARVAGQADAMRGMFGLIPKDRNILRDPR